MTSISINKPYTRKFLFRAWYYFRIGYSTYLAFTLGSINMLITTYYLAIRDSPFLQALFPSFIFWGLGVSLVVAPIAVAIGWFHFKRSRAYRSEMDVAFESNPYYYKLPPGYWKEALVPAVLALINMNMKLTNNDLTENEKRSLEKIRKDLGTLLGGGYVGGRTFGT